MILRKIISWPSRLHDGGAGAHSNGVWESPSSSRESSRHGPSGDISRQGPGNIRRARSTGVLRQDCFECHFKPDHITDAVYYDDQRTIDAILARGGIHEVRAAIIWRVSRETIRKLYAKGCHDQDFMHNLFSAARFNHPEVLDALLDHTGLTFATLERVEPYRVSLLYAASQAGHAGIVSRLLERGANPRVGRFVPGFLGRHKRETSCLETAVRNGNATVTRLLLEKTHPHLRELNEMLDIAIHQEDKACCQMLLLHGAKPEHKAQEKIEALRDALLSVTLRKALAAA